MLTLHASPAGSGLHNVHDPTSALRLLMPQPSSDGVNSTGLLVDMGIIIRPRCPNSATAADATFPNAAELLDLIPINAAARDGQVANVTINKLQSMLQWQADSQAWKPARPAHQANSLSPQCLVLDPSKPIQSIPFILAGSCFMPGCMLEADAAHACSSLPCNLSSATMLQASSSHPGSCTRNHPTSDDHTTFDQRSRINSRSACQPAGSPYLYQPGWVQLELDVDLTNAAPGLATISIWQCPSCHQPPRSPAPIQPFGPAGSFSQAPTLTPHAAAPHAAAPALGPSLVAVKTLLLLPSGHRSAAAELTRVFALAGQQTAEEAVADMGDLLGASYSRAAPSAQQGDTPQGCGATTVGAAAAKAAGTCTCGPVARDAIDAAMVATQKVQPPTASNTAVDSGPSPGPAVTCSSAETSQLSTGGLPAAAMPLWHAEELLEAAQDLQAWCCASGCPASAQLVSHCRTKLARRLQPTMAAAGIPRSGGSLNNSE